MLYTLVVQLVKITTASQHQIFVKKNEKLNFYILNGKKILKLKF